MNSSNVCIVDDNIAVCDALRFLFESVLNLTVTTYNDPIVFLAQFIPDWNGCLIIDLFMPSMNGFDLLKKLKKINPNIKVIVLSGHLTLEAGAKALAIGASSFLTKPFKTNELLDKVKQLLKVIS